MRTAGRLRPRQARRRLPRGRLEIATVAGRALTLLVEELERHKLSVVARQRRCSRSPQCRGISAAEAHGTFVVSAVAPVNAASWSSSTSS